VFDYTNGETEHGFAVFFSQKPNKMFCLVSVKKTQQTRFCENSIEWEKWVWVCWVWVAVYGFVVFGFC